VHLTSSPVDWYAARGAGILAYIVLSFVVVLGTTMAGKRAFARWPRFALEDVHRFAGLLVGAFITVHVVTVAIDSYLPFSLTSLVVPLTSRYRPIWIALGVVAAELLLALAVTNRYRGRLSYGFWRKMHYANFVVWTAATLHGLGSGTDRSSPWFLLLYGLATGAVVVAIAASLGRRGLLRPARPVALVAAAGAVALVAALGLGPLRFHPKPWNAMTFNDTLKGRVLRNLGVTRGIISMAGTGSGEQRVLVRADLLIRPQQIEDTSFQMEFLPSGMLCLGRVTHVQSFSFDAHCRAADGSERVIVATWTQSSGPGFTNGTLTVHA
jgi:methionine sulfoxide reductase heme-binding subunit